MATEQQSGKKRRRLPFNPPSRASSGAGPSKSKSKAKQTTTQKASSSLSSAKPTSRKSTTKSSTSTSEGKRPRAESPPSSASDNASDNAASDSESSSSSTQSRQRSLSQEPDYILAEITTSKNNPSEDVSSTDPTIPSKLLTRLVHHHFNNEKTKLAKDANAAVAKYVDVFVREAIARAAYERVGTEGGSAGRGAVVDGFLEVEDLEKMAPQLMMDF